MNLAAQKLTDAEYPMRVRERLGDRAPQSLYVIGNPALLNLPKTALFCSLNCPTEVAQRAHDLAEKLRERGIAVIGGFHSPIEKDCLNILLHGEQPIIICLLRALSERTRVPTEWQNALASGRLLLLSSIAKTRRPDEQSARKRNELAVALADDIAIIHSEPGGNIEQISQLAHQWGVPPYNPR